MTPGFYKDLIDRDHYRDRFFFFLSLFLAGMDFLLMTVSLFATREEPTVL